MPRTTPALASLLSGAYPHTTAVRTLTDPLGPGVVTAAQLFARAGYQTFAVVTNQVLARDRQLDRGFAFYDVAADARRAEATTDAALRALAATKPSAPVFAWVHYIDPHVPYHPAPATAKRLDPDYEGPYALRFGDNGDAGAPRRTFPEDLPKEVATHRNPLPERVNAHVRRLYAADIHDLDAAVGRLWEGFRRRLGDDVLLVFTADHGESLGEHDFYFDHGDYVYNAGTRVPLAFVLPRAHPLAGSGRCRGWVSLVDVLPTLLELVGLDPPRDQIEGRSLVDCMRGVPLPDTAVFVESGRSYYFDSVRRRQRNDIAGRFRAVVRGRWKLVWTPFLPDEEAWELYDLEADPQETRNLYAADHPAVGALARELSAWLAREATPRVERPLSEADRQALRALGYLE